MVAYICVDNTRKICVKYLQLQNNHVIRCYMGVAMPHFDVWFLLYDEVLWILLCFWSKEFVLFTGRCNIM